MCRAAAKNDVRMSYLGRVKMPLYDRIVRKKKLRWAVVTRQICLPPQSFFSSLRPCYYEIVAAVVVLKGQDREEEIKMSEDTAVPLVEAMWRTKIQRRRI